MTILWDIKDGLVSTLGQKLLFGRRQLGVARFVTDLSLKTKIPASLFLLENWHIMLVGAKAHLVGILPRASKSVLGPTIFYFFVAIVINQLMIKGLLVAIRLKSFSNLSKSTKLAFVS